MEIFFVKMKLWSQLNDFDRFNGVCFYVIVIIQVVLWYLIFYRARWL